MFLDKLPVSYAVYTENGLVKIIVGIEVATQHWDKVQQFSSSTSFGLLPLYVGGHNSFLELMEVIPEEDIVNIVTVLVPMLTLYIDDPTDEHLKLLLEQYKEINNEQEKSN
ncbi:hypothetical protein KC678_05850 [Candidatus Dojkabacteria bacterium]|uniref:Uncharacterized protein n=1 Tax=Candidatus Dojkabacteria bacterium TaxID=2099670 RepID=A0A955RHM5_9BACT|nr:hypothetical protein [Candidatus Dojkabacteria bacterium]